MIPNKAIANTEEATLTKESEKLREKCLKSWKKLILGLRIRQRLQATYASKTALPVEGESQVRLHIITVARW